MMKNKEKKILIGSCGGLTGSYLSRQYKKYGYTVFGIDANAINVTKNFVDKFIEFQGVDSGYIDRIAKLLNDEKIDYYLPTHSSEIIHISEHEEELKTKTSAKFIVSPYETFKNLDNKDDANKSLGNIGVPVPELIESPNENTNYPIFYKPNHSSGSKGVLKINSYEEVPKIIKGSFYEFIDGKEYTVDMIFNDKGKMLAYNPRYRMKNMGGAVIITQNDYKLDIKPYLDKIVDNFIFKGCVNFQYIIKNNIPYFTDINPRYPSGGLPLTVESGINIPLLLLDIMDGKKLNEIKSCQADGKIMYRYFEEIYEG